MPALVAACRGPNPAFTTENEADGGEVSGEDDTGRAPSRPAPGGGGAAGAAPRVDGAASGGDLRGAGGAGGTGGAGGAGNMGGTGGRPAGAGGVDAGGAAPDGPGPACLSWGHADSTRRLAIEIAGGPGGVAAGTWASLVFDHAALVAAGRSRADGNDVRVLRWDGLAWSDVAFFLDERSRWNMASTTLWLRAAVAVPANGRDRSHYLHAGDLGAAAPAARRPSALLRSVQTGTAVQDRLGTTSVPLQQVDPARSFVLFQTRHANDRPTGALIQARLADIGRALDLVRVDADFTPPRIDVRYHVLEFSNGVRVQRGVLRQNAATVTAALATPVAVEQTFLLWSKTPQVLGFDWDANDPMFMSLRDARTIESRVGAYRDADHEVAWEAVELTNPEDARVQRGTVAVDQNDATVTPARAVDVQRALLLAGFNVPSTGPRTLGAKMLRAQIRGPSSLAFHRSTRASFELLAHWQLVELGAGAQVRSGTLDFAAGETQKRVALSPPVDVVRAAPLVSVQVGGGQAMGATPYLDADLIGVCAVTLSIAAGGAS